MRFSNGDGEIAGVSRCHRHVEFIKPQEQSSLQLDGLVSFVIEKALLGLAFIIFKE